MLSLDQRAFEDTLIENDYTDAFRNIAILCVMYPYYLTVTRCW